MLAEVLNFQGAKPFLGMGSLSDLFEIADEAYAVSNADEDLKKIATGVIGDNNEDAVAKWLLNNFA